MLNSAATSSGIVSKLFQTIRSEIDQGISFQPTPEVFHWIQFWGVWGKEMNGESSCSLEKRTYLSGSVRHEPIPDDDNGCFNLPS